MFWLWCSAAWAAPPAQSVGDAVCKSCHPNVTVDFYRNPHYQSVASGKEKPEDTGCEGCHGPASAHVAARGDRTKITAFSAMTPKKILDNCLRCHAESLGRANIRRSSHSQAQIACTSCHTIHRAKSPKFLLASSEQRDVCYGCHGNVRAQFSQPFKHRVNEGFMTCSDCHNPHGAAAPNSGMGGRPRMMQAGLGNEEPCMKCHTDKRGPFAFEHVAGRVDGCGSCHAPHGTANAKMLRRPAVFTTCLECHNGADSFGTRNNGIPTHTASHNLFDPRYRQCTTCHVRIHGSNGDPLFLR